MHRGRASITSTAPTNIVDARFDADCSIFATSTPHGFAVYKTNPLKLIRRRNLTGTISKILPLHSTNLIFLVGGGRNPQYPPNKVILWDEALGRVVGEIEFSEQVRGLACRRGTLVVALKRRVVQFEISPQGIVKTREWDTCDNERGLVALATAEGSTLLIMPGPPGPNAGHVRLVHLKPCPPKPPPSPPPNTAPSKESTSSSSFAPPRDPVSIIKAHTTSLSCLAVTRSGRYLATTSSRGTLLRVWDTLNGQMVREFRRGADQAFIYGIAFRPDEAEICVWSDKGTIHIFKIHDSEGAGNRVSAFSSLSAYLPKYVGSEWSYAEFRLPSSSKHIALSAASAGTVIQAPDPDAAEEEKATVGWIQVSLPPSIPPPPPLSSSPSSKSSRRPSSSSSKPGTPQQPPQPKTEYQLIALAFSGGWYRLSPSPSSTTASSSRSSSFGESGSVGRPGFFRGSPSVASSRPTEKGKERAHNQERDEGKARRKCQILEYKRFGEWDGW
ncbi:hypothetical protein M407DRAFT_25665 [Tulasnella calospora MUT 4182]|uniref:Uncharacterized protein n=1 Tax=Tulasnella calospora MUT 4182 TaxID=1051891 RepID=A0A0C3Q6L1_9AGAM|nr:hypothetical protein M407DRAFT_25665 [Tulasnella calospora MUT 4182]